MSFPDKLRVYWKEGRKGWMDGGKQMEIRGERKKGLNECEHGQLRLNVEEQIGARGEEERGGFDCLLSKRE
jgi:hypothetical protein